MSYSGTSGTGVQNQRRWFLRNKTIYRGYTALDAIERRIRSAVCVDNRSKTTEKTAGRGRIGGQENRSASSLRNELQGTPRIRLDMSVPRSSEKGKDGALQLIIAGPRKSVAIPKGTVQSLKNCAKEDAARFRAASSVRNRIGVSCFAWIRWFRSSCHRKTCARRRPTPGRKQPSAHVQAVGCSL